MSSVPEARRRVGTVVFCLLMAAAVGLAQKPVSPSAKPASASANTVLSTRNVLLEKARASESRSRPDLALQLWQQMLLSDPSNTEALAGVARCYKLMGNNDKATEALTRLRAVSPNDPNISRIEAMSSSQAESEQLKKAGVLAQQNKPDEAMAVYRKLYGNTPPGGDVALGYYQTLYATKTGKADAIAGMRALVAKNPGYAPYNIALGTMLTYQAPTRAEGIRILQANQNNPDAQAALRQALIWNAANPATAGQLRTYLSTHPKDQEVARDLQQAESTLARMNSGIARTPEEQAAFAALNSNRIDEAEKRFAALIDQDPTNGRVIAGMGFLRMKQQNFGAAISFLSQAEAEGYKEKAVEDALANSRFWYTMGEATQAFDNNQFDLARMKYTDALAMNPKSPDALKGLAGIDVKQEQFAKAAEVYYQLLRIRPADGDGWRGLFLAYAREKEYGQALDTVSRFPASVRATLAKDPDYLQTLATIYQAQGHNAEAQRVLAQALALPFPDDGSALALNTRVQYAGILNQVKRYEEALTLFIGVINKDPSNLSAWEGLVTARHNLGQDSEAVNDLKMMPTATYDAALADPGFLSMLGAIYQQAHQYDVALGFLDRAQKQMIAAGGTPTVDLQLQMASLYLLSNDPTSAYAIYRQVLLANPENAGAWQGLINTLHATNRDSEALQQIAQIPSATRKELESSIEFVQTEAGLYAGAGDTTRALEYARAVEDHYAKLHQQPPADIDVENAWLLYNAGNDRLLYPDLMRLGGRTDLTAAQRETVQNIWANWSVRRAGTAFDNGNYRRAVDILDAANQAFPNNLAVRKAVAGGYVRVGRAKEALALFKTVPLQDATSGDFQGAIGAALAANDKAQAEIWLREAMDRYPRDPAILTLAAQYEQARGDSGRAADYYRASIAVMPRVTPVDRLAHILVNPDEDTKTHKAVTAADLEKLLDPNSEPFQKTTKLPALPAYGADPYAGTAPVMLTQPSGQPANKTTPTTSPASNVQPLPGGGSGPYILPIPNGALSAPQLFARPVAVSSGGTGAGQASGQAAASTSTYIPNTPILANPPHSMASDAWMGLVFSLVSGGRNAEALQELSKIPLDVRAQLESNVEFVQGIASLYLAVGDVGRAQSYLSRAEGYYQIHRMNMPAGLEIQHAWLLYNLKDDAALYPVMQRLDIRGDLTAAQHTDMENLWASWAVRRATDAMDRGNMLRGVEILQAASQDYPSNLTIRRAVAGAYARVGRGADAVALYKTIPMDDAPAGDYQGAISAALTAGDMAQAEIWLRQALAKSSNDPGILALAAQFEQARGNNERATAFWRAALAAMPPGSAIQPLPTVAAFPPGTYRAPAAGDTKKLLDPRLDPLPPVGQQTPLPSYRFQPGTGVPAPEQQQTVPVQPSAPSNTRPSNSPLPMPSSSPSYGPGYGQPGGVPTGASLYIPQRQDGGISAHTPALIEQSAVQGPAPQPYRQTGSTPRTNNDSASNLGQFMGRVNLPPSEQTISTPPPNLPAPRQANGTPRASEQAQLLFGGQTDSQLTQGGAIHPLANSPANVGYTSAQYTPSAQEATTGAYSAAKPSDQPQAQAQPAEQKPQPETPAQQITTTRRKTKKSKTTTQTLGNAPIVQNQETLSVPQQTQAQPVAPIAVPQPQTSTGPGLTDEELQDRELPPLRGPWVRTQRQAAPLSPRDLAEQQLTAIQSSYSAWMGGTGDFSYRSGALGFSHLAMMDVPMEVSLPLGFHARFTVVAKPVFLDSGQADGTATMTVVESTVSGSTAVNIPEPLGTLTTTDTTPPPQQNAVGLGGEIQLAFPHFALAGGYTPNGFLVSTFTGRLFWKPGNGPLTFSFVRDSVKDSELSYSGLRDPAGASLATLGAIWGGVVSNQGTIQYSRGDAQSGFYFAGSGQYLTGYNVENNKRYDGTAGAYWRAFVNPEYGTLSIGANFFAMHYDNNQNAFTYGMGGYFSPQGYFLGNVPFTWDGHYGTKLHYSVMGAAGVQAFSENATPLWPLPAQKATETANNNAMLPNFSSVGANYDLRFEGAYQVTPHWFVGARFEANDSRDYGLGSGSFFIRYVFREQPSTVSGPTGNFPSDGFRPFTVP